MGRTKKFGKRRNPCKRNVVSSNVNIVNDGVIQSNITSNVVIIGLVSLVWKVGLVL